MPETTNVDPITRQTLQLATAVAEQLRVIWAARDAAATQAVPKKAVDR